MDWTDFWENVSTCSTCHALVLDAAEEEHKAWHVLNSYRPNPDGAGYSV